MLQLEAEDILELVLDLRIKMGCPQMVSRYQAVALLSAVHLPIYTTKGLEPY